MQGFIPGNYGSFFCKLPHFLFFFSLMKRNKNQGLRKKKLKIYRQG